MFQGGVCCEAATDQKRVHGNSFVFDLILLFVVGLGLICGYEK